MVDAFSFNKKNENIMNVSLIETNEYLNNIDLSDTSAATFNSEFDLNDGNYNLIKNDQESISVQNVSNSKTVKISKCITPFKMANFSDSSKFGTCFNFINSIIGSGVIGMPYAINQSGIGVSIFLFALVGLLTDYSIMILISSGEKLGVKTYQDLVDLTLGRGGYIVLVLIQFLYPFISLVSYNIIIGDTITKVFVRLFAVSTSSILNNRHFVNLFISILIIFPLCLFRNISKLSKTSFISCLSLFFIQVVMITKFFSMREKVTPTTDAFKFIKSFDGVTDSFSIMAFGFMCHHNSFLIYNSMDKPCLKSWKLVTKISISFGLGISVLFGFIGYLTFLDFTQGDIFENYCQNDDLINVIRLIYAFIIMFSFPLELFVCREVIENTFFRPIKGNTRLHTLVTVLLIFTALFLSFTTDCLGIVLELNGSLVATVLAYILPCLCALIINYKQGKSWTESIKPAIILLFGTLVMVSGLKSIVDKIFKGYSCSHGTQMEYCKASNQSQIIELFQLNISSNYNSTF